MSRWLYTFGVAADPLLSHIRSLVEDAKRENAPIDLVSIERILLAGAESPSPTVAFYRVLLDGWHATHTAITQYGLTADTSILHLLQHLEEHGVVWIRDEAVMSAASAINLHSCQNEPGYYAILAFVAAIVDCSRFAAATDRPGVVICRCLGASCDDAHFRSSSSR